MTAKTLAIASSPPSCSIDTACTRYISGVTPLGHVDNKLGLVLIGEEQTGGRGEREGREGVQFANAITMKDLSGAKANV